MSIPLIITKPESNEYPEWFEAEIGPVHYNDLIYGFNNLHDQSLELLSSLNDEQLFYRYETGKWSIKEIWQHLIDVERILGYRALRYARKDQTVLSGFNEKQYTIESKADEREWKDILDEYSLVRKSNISLFSGFTPEMRMNRGTAGKSELTVRAVGYLVLGHNLHHLKIIKERYLKLH